MSILRNSFAGSFYPNNPVILQKQLDAYFSNTTKTIQKPKAIIVPHAGYTYSAQTVAYGYKQLTNETIKTIIVLAPAHRTFHQSLAIPAETILETPLGNLDVHQDMINILLSSELFVKDSRPHYQEHSLEVQLPFIKHLLPSCNIIPINVGMIDIALAKKAATELANITDAETVIIVSNDLSHYHSLQTAKQIDENTINHILKMSPENLITQHQKKEIECCGIFPTTLLLATLNELEVNNHKVLHYDTSASASFDDKQVVGYASIAFY